MVFFRAGLAPGCEVLGEGGVFLAGEVGEGLPVLGIFFEEGEDEIGEGPVEGAFGGRFAESLAVFLVEGGCGFRGQGVAAFDDAVGIGGEVFAVVFEVFVGGLFFPLAGELTEGEEGGGFAEGFLEPFIFVRDGLEVGTDVGEFVGELVDDLRVVVIAGIELYRDFAARGSFVENDGAVGVAGDEDGGILLGLGFWEGPKGFLEEGAEVFFAHFETGRIETDLGGELRKEGQDQEDKSDGGLHFLRLGSRLPLTRAAMSSGQEPFFRSRSQVASMRRLWRTVR